MQTCRREKSERCSKSREIEMGSMYILRGTLAFFFALICTALLCLIAPLISSNKQDISFTEPITPIQVASLPSLKPKVEKKPLQPEKQLPLPKTLRPPVTKQRPIEKVALTMRPLKVELPTMRAASIPAAPQQVDQKMASAYGGNSIFDLGTVDTPPRLQKYNPPLYPVVAKGQRIEGKVVVRCIVTAKGQVKEMKIISADPAGYFEKAALNAIAKWTFIAAKYQGETVSVYVDIPLTFSLD